MGCLYAIIERVSNAEIDNLLLVVDKPLTKILPEVHEDNNDEG